MSKLNVDEIRNGADSTTTPPAIPGLQPQVAQAWVNFNGTGVVAIRDSFNTSSITDNGTGNYSVNFTVSLSNTDYSVVCSARDVGSSNGAMPTGYNATDVVINTFTSSSGAVVDCDFVNVVIFSN